MSQSKSSIEERYAAVMELKGGASLSTVGKKYRMGLWTLKALLNRYEKLGIGKGTYARDSGVYTKKGSHLQASRQLPGGWDEEVSLTVSGNGL